MDPKKRKDAPGSNNPDTKKLKLDDSLDEFSAVRDLDEGFLNDPSLKESVTQVLSDPAYRQMSQQLEYLLTASTHPQYNEEAYLSAACRVFGNDQLSAFMRHIGQAVDEDLSKPNPKLRLVPALKTIHDKVVAGGRPAFIRYWTDREALAELVGAIKLSITANCPNSVEKPEAEEPAYKDEPVLHRYARAGDIISLEEALKSGADKNILDIYGGTALHAACAYGQDKCVEILLKYGYAVTAVDSHKHTPLHLAVFHGFPLCVNSLLNYGAHVTIWLKNDEGESPMDFAVDDDLNRNDVLKMLLKKLESVSVATG